MGVDIDLAQFFDRVNPDRLMSWLALRRADKGVLKLVRAYCLQLGGLKPPPLGGSFSRFSVSLEA